MKKIEIKLKRVAAAQVISALFILHLSIAPLSARAADLFSPRSTNAPTRVVIVENPDAVTDFQPDPAIVQDMVSRGLTNLTGKATLAGAWRSLVSTQDIVGIKVCANPAKSAAHDRRWWRR